MSRPDAGTPDVVGPDVVATDVARPDTSCPDATPADVGRPGALPPEQARPAARAPARATVKAMREFRRPGLWLWVWALMIAVVIAGSLLPSGELPPVPFNGFDKVEHFFGYAVQSAYAAMLFARLRSQALAAAGLFALGIGLEIAQGVLTTSRQADLADAMVNALGVLAGLAVAATPLARLLQRLDARLP